MRPENGLSGGVSTARIAFNPCLRAVEGTVGGVAKSLALRSEQKHSEIFMGRFVMHNLISLLNALLRDNRLWIPEPPPREVPA